MYKLKIKHFCWLFNWKHYAQSLCIVLVPCCFKYRQVHAHTTYDHFIFYTEHQRPASPPCTPTASARFDVSLSVCGIHTMEAQYYSFKGPAEPHIFAGDVLQCCIFETNL